MKAWTAVLLGVLASAGCGKGEPGKEAASGTEAAGEKAAGHAADESHASEGGDVVRIEADMLGDVAPETVEVVRGALGRFARALEATNPSPRPRPLGGAR